MGCEYSVTLTKEAYYKLCQLRDILEDLTGGYYDLDEYCCSLILECYSGACDEKIT